MNNDIKRVRGRPPRTEPDPRTPEQRRTDRLAKRRQRGIETLASLNVLPDAARLRMLTVEAALGFSSATIWRKIRAGQIAAPAYDGRVPFWTARQVREMLAGE